ncbi:monocarboxylate transporter [Elysia marginata]|uniref:Monocarboxylate transporter n=1 Tax=Elysia marginata TaxID=1093978 RepID=A0AAV4HUC2_9GAST|nr:monocarboxylate transporter [Elysia marginata]
MTVIEGGYDGWIAVFSCFYHHAFVSSSVYALSVYYGSWVEDFDTGRGVTSWVLTLSIAISMGSGPVVSSLCTRFGHRRIIIAGSVICAVGFLIASFATSIYAIVFLIGGVSGFGLGMQYLPSLAIIPFFFNKRRSFAIGVAVSGAGVGVFLYPPLLIWLEEQYTWRGAMLILSGISLNMVVCGALLKPFDENAEDIKDSDAHRPCTLSDEKLSQSNCHEAEKQALNGSITEDNLRHPLRLDAYEAVDLASANDLRSSKNRIEMCGSTHVVTSPNHLSNYHNTHNVGSSRSLARSHVDIYLSTSFFDLNEADRKRTDSLRQSHVSLCQGIDKSRPPSHLDSLLQLSNEHGESSLRAKGDLMCGSSHRKPRTLSKFSCSSCLPQRYLEILKNPFFFSLAVCYVLICFTTLVPVAYMVDRAVDERVDKTKAALAFSMYGAGNLFGRMALGVLADQGLDSLLLCATCLMISGVSTCLSPLCGGNAILHGLYGFTFGTCMGWVYDATNSYTLSFTIHGAIVLVATVGFVIIKVAVVLSYRKAALLTAAAAAATTHIDHDVHVADENQSAKSDVDYENECGNSITYIDGDNAVMSDNGGQSSNRVINKDNCS